MIKQDVTQRIVLLLLISILAVPTLSQLTIADQSQPSLQHVTISPPYPTVSQLVTLTIELSGKTIGRYHLTIIDTYDAFVFTGNTCTWTTDHVVIYDSFIKPRGRQITVDWYPVLAGNHTLTFIVGSSPLKNITVPIGFDVEHIIYPSLGCPELIQDNNQVLMVFLSEERNNTDPPSQIQSMTLTGTQTCMGTIFENEKPCFTTWIPTSKRTVEDDSIYIIRLGSLNPGLYDLRITTSHQTYNWLHAVFIQDHEPASARIVHLSDIHMGKTYNTIDEEQRLTDVFSFLNTHIQPDLIILTGDLVDWSTDSIESTNWNTLKNILVTSDYPLFTIPGNHDRYTEPLRRLYRPYTNLTGYHQNINPLSDYTLDYAGIHVICLDSGYDYSRWELKPFIINPTPESTGLTNTQLHLLKTSWGKPTSPQIIAMHHPAVNTKNDRGLFALSDTLPSGNDECIAFNRGHFIDYCLNNNVALSISGHTHENTVLTSKGTGSFRQNLWPLFVQTTSATLSQHPNGRLITITNQTITGYAVMRFS